MLKEFQKDGEISEDELRKGLEKVQEVTDDYVKKVDEVVGVKEEEIMEF
jgi:ribosome recycling factor